MGLQAAANNNRIKQLIGAKKLQTLGFLIITFCFVVLGAMIVPLKDSAPMLLYSLYCLLLFALSFGPNLTTYILPAQIYPKEVRTTFNGT